MDTKNQIDAAAAQFGWRIDEDVALTIFIKRERWVLVYWDSRGLVLRWSMTEGTRSVGGSNPSQFNHQMRADVLAILTR